jgi:hypothetical protein
MRGGWFASSDSPVTAEQLVALEHNMTSPLPMGLTNGVRMMARRVIRSGNIKHPSGLTVRNAEIERAKPFVWAWDQRVLVEYVNLLIGEEGIGKGNLVAWIVAKLTRGALPGDLHGKPSPVAIIGDEDSFDHVWVPRLEAAGADRERVKYIAGVDGNVFDVQEHVDQLRSYIKAEKPALIYIDQLLDNLGVANSWKDKEIRNALAPLRALAQDTKVAVLCTMHPNKRTGAFRDRISGSPAFNALSRSSLLLGPHPAEAGRVAVVRGKGNYAAEPEAFEFRIEEQAIALTKPRRTIKASYIVDTRTTALTRDRLLNSMDGESRGRNNSKAGLARRLLAELFADGEERSAGQVQLQLHREHGLNAREVTKAADELEFVRRKQGFQGEWRWRAKGATE